MRTISPKQKYRTIRDEDIGEIKRRNDYVKKSKYMQKFHINPISGLLNDPNGFCYYNERWHLFYQWFPFGGFHGAKNWYHTSSTDLIHWENEGTALKTDTTYDNRGAYSGNAFIQDDKLYLIYTGNHKDENDVRHPYQVVAEYDEGKFVKHPPIISMNDDYTEHQRDPKIIKQGDIYYLIIGAQNMEKKGRLLVYSSNDITGNWQFKGEMNIKGYENFGYMWECPDIAKIGDKYLFLFSPQGLQSDGYRFGNIFQNGYLIGDVDFENLIFTPTSSFEELDRGFDFYASQTAFVAEKDRDDIQKSLPSYDGSSVIMSAWMGLPDSSYTTDESEDYSGCLALTRMLSIEDGRLIQRPVGTVNKIKGDTVFQGKASEYKSKIETPILFEINEVDSSPFSLKVYYDEKDNTGFFAEYNDGVFKITRDMHNKLNENQGITRAVEIQKIDEIQVFIDSSSVEIFINDGQYTLSSRVFPSDEERELIFESDISVYVSSTTLLQSVKNEFVL